MTVHDTDPTTETQSSETDTCKNGDEGCPGPEAVGETDELDACFECFLELDREHDSEPHAYADGGREIAGTLRVVEDELVLPDWLVGHVGKFTMRTPNVTGDMETTEAGLGKTNYILGSVPEEGDYHEDLDAGQVALTTPGNDEKVYRVVEDDEATLEEVTAE